MKGDLESVLKKEGKKIPLVKRLRMARDSALGMSWLHGICHIIHRDFKPANLLVDENYRVKVTDFGFAEIKPENRFLKDQWGPRGTALWMAPEVMQQEGTRRQAHFNCPYSSH
jgi:serine/threonine protein kinase